MYVNLAYLLQEQASRQPAAIALIDSANGPSHGVTFEQLYIRSAKAAALLRQKGLTAGDRVLLFHPMSAELYIALGAIFHLGLIALFVDPSAGADHINRCCRMAQPSALIATAKAHLLRLKSAELRGIPVKFSTGFGVPGADRWSRSRLLAPDTDAAVCTEETPALATFTSGSTGVPKMAVRSHGFLRKQHQAIEDTLGLGPGDVILSTLPIFVLSHIASGATTLIPNVDIRYPGRVKPAPLVQQLQAEKVNCIEGPPALFERIERQCVKDGIVLPAVRKAFTGGAPVFPDLLLRLKNVMPQAAVTAVYGSTEAEPIAHVELDEISDDDMRAMTAGAGLLAGSIIASAQVCIIPDSQGVAIGPFTESEFAEHCLQRNQPGEIVVTGPHVLRGYWQGHGDSETKFSVGGAVWHRTGDAGYFDIAGRLWLLGRCIARIEDEHGVLYPFAVECAAHRRLEVKQAAFVIHNERRLLALELRKDGGARCDPSALADAILAELAWAQIDEVRILDNLPVDKRHNSKVDYSTLHHMLSLL